MRGFRHQRRLRQQAVLQQGSGGGEGYDSPGEWGHGVKEVLPFATCLLGGSVRLVWLHLTLEPFSRPTSSQGPR